MAPDALGWKTPDEALMRSMTACWTEVVDFPKSPKPGGKGRPRGESTIALANRDVKFSSTQFAQT
jgi:hypothetical protein